MSQVLSARTRYAVDLTLNHFGRNLATYLEGLEAQFVGRFRLQSQQQLVGGVVEPVSPSELDRALQTGDLR